MGISVKTAPTVEPVTRAELKNYLRIDNADATISVEQSIVPGAHVVAASYSLQGSGVDVLGYQATVTLDSGACGSGGSVAAKIQESTNNSTFTDWTGGGFTTVTEANDNATQTLSYTGDRRYIRVVATVATATCDFGAAVSKQTLTTDESAILDGLVEAARRYVEAARSEALITTVLTWKLDEFPSSLRLGDHTPTLRLPVWPVQSVASIKYIDTNGTQQTLAAANYRTDLTSTPARITEAYGTSWPSTRDITDAVEIEFTAGYGDATTDVPEYLRLAVEMLAAHWYEHREAASETALSKAPIHVERLINLKNVKGFA